MMIGLPKAMVLGLLTLLGPSVWRRENHRLLLLCACGQASPFDTHPMGQVLF